MLSILTENRCLIKLFQIGSILTSHCDLTMDGFFCLIMNKATRHSYCVLVIIGKIPYCGIFRNFLLNHWYKPVATMARIGYPKFGYPRVIPGPEPNFGYGLGWVCVWIPWVFSGWVPIKVKILGFFGYYPWVPMRIGYPKLGHPRVIPELYYDKKCSYIQKYKYY
jgi:hypothetical protein